MRTLNPLNSATYFCPICGIGPADGCTAPHVVNEMAQPGSNARSILILTLAIGAMVVAVGLFTAIKS